MLSKCELFWLISSQIFLLTFPLYIPHFLDSMLFPGLTLPGTLLAPLMHIHIIPSLKSQVQIFFSCSSIPAGGYPSFLWTLSWHIIWTFIMAHTALSITYSSCFCAYLISQLACYLWETGLFVLFIFYLLQYILCTVHFIGNSINILWIKRNVKKKSKFFRLIPTICFRWSLW